MFTSKRPEDFDPEPYLGASGDRYDTEQALELIHNHHAIELDPRPHFQPTRDPLPFEGPFGNRRAIDEERMPHFVWAPRPEFTTPGNPILVEFRDFKDEFWGPIPTRDSAQDWLDLLADDPTMDDPSNWGNLAGNVTPEQIEHARKVLTRLAVLGG